MTVRQPTRILIAALGGEGGGVLAGWITEAAVASGLVASRTSIPGVAQRTGATTYYIEIVETVANGTYPVLSLNPAPGEVDVVLASELLEAARMAQAGYVSPDRTTLIASSHRVFTTAEKMALGDGRLDPERLASVLGSQARHLVLEDYQARAKAALVPLNAVLLGALAASAALPVTADALRDAIRAQGKAVAPNLAGFEEGLARASRQDSDTRPHQSPVSLVTSPVGDLTRFPEPVRGVLALGFSRLVDYQDEAYALLYLDRVRRVSALPGAGADLITALARHLAVRMSFEDTIRVAELKLRQARIARVAVEANARPGDIVDITEYLKPGPDEILSLLPPATARRLLAFVERRGWGRKAFPMKVRTTRAGGMLRLKLLAAQKRRRRKTLRFHQENAWIEGWLSLIERTLHIDSQAAGEVIETAKLVRGYGDTYTRGAGNWQTIARDVIEPALMGALGRSLFADAVLQARIAAEKDPDGDALARTIAAMRDHAGPRPPATPLAAQSSV